LYHAVVPASPPPDVRAAAIFIAAQAAWNARSVPAYESFTLPCAQTFLAGRCKPGVTIQFIVRTADGRSFAQTIDAGGKPGTVLLRGGEIIGPAGAPFGFYRRTPLPGALPTVAPSPAVQSDPIATIASVTAIDRAYDVTLEGTVLAGGRACYHLRLLPLRNPALYPLRELLVDEDTDEIAGLTYAQPFDTTTATVHYRFAPAGAEHVWSIVHIDAEAGAQRVSQDLENIAFPRDVPAADFIP
jgi:hypothetical protein